MKHKRSFSLALLMWIVLLGAKAQTNRIYIADINIAAGGMATLSVNMDNVDDVIAVDFMLEVPSGFTVETSSAVLATRAQNHDLTAKKLSNGKYRFLLMSNNNNSISGNTGLLFTVPITASTSVSPGTQQSMTMSSAVMSTKSGENVLQESNGGLILVKNIPSGYLEIENTDLCYNKNVISYNNSNIHSIDIKGHFNGTYYRSTYGDRGYDLAVQVDNNSPTFVDCQTGTTTNGVRIETDVVRQAGLARVCYYVTNTNNADVTVSLGIHADVMIGDNDSAPIVRKIDTIGNTYGLALLDGGGAQLCVLFGNGLAGVTGVSDFWFGSWDLNSSPSEIVGNYNQGGSWMVENGGYDSGMGWCWKNRIVPAGATVVFSWLIGVGDVKLEPSSNFEVTPEDPEGWNDLSRLHVLTLEGDYESPAGLAGTIEYAVEDSEEWIPLTEMLESGSTFSGEVRAMFNTSLPTHTIRFRTVDQVGNTTLLPPIVYPDVSFYSLDGIVDKVYTGDSLYQESLTSNANDSLYAIAYYSNNLNAGTASFNMEGVFPYTIGRKRYTFTISKQPLSGTLQLENNKFVYNGQAFAPDWQFSNENYVALQEGQDYTAVWSNNRLPGEGTLIVSGKGNYTGSLSATITIDKASLTDDLYSFTVPETDITYDEKSHGGTVTVANGVGQATLTYLKQGETEPTTSAPVEPGNYTVSLTIADGELYYGLETTELSQFTIYQFDADEWAILQTIHNQLEPMGWNNPWNLTQGIKSASTLQGLTIKNGHVVGINLSNQNIKGEFPSHILDLTQIQTLNLSGNQLYGNIGQHAETMESLTALDISNNAFDQVTPMLPATISNLNIGKQTISRLVELQLPQLSMDYFAEQIPNILTYDHAQQNYSKTIRLLCTSPDGKWTTTLRRMNGQVTFVVTSGNNVYRGQDGDTFNVALLNSNGSREGSTFRMSLSFDTGDGNFDGKVDVLDLQSTINYIMETYQSSRLFNFTAANLWEDEIINVQDAVSMVNLLLDMEPTPSRQMSRRTAEQTNHPANINAFVFIENGELILSTSEPVFSFDIVVISDKKFAIAESLRKKGFSCVTKQNGSQTHLIVYSLSGASLPVGQTIIGETGDGTVIYAMLSDQNATEIPSSTEEVVTGIQTGKTTVPSNDVNYKFPLGANRYMIIDANGKKSILKNEK